MISKPKFKIARRLGPIFEKTQTQKFTLSQARKSKSAGRKPKSLTDYGLQLIEKQKIRFGYGISEKQFGNYILESMKSKGVAPALKLQEFLESRLDNVVYRLGVAPTRLAARQMVAHGHILINGKRVSSPSYQVRVGDQVSVREGSKNKNIFQELDKKLKNYRFPEWLRFDASALTGKIESKPKTDDSSFDFEAVLEFYSR